MNEVLGIVLEESSFKKIEEKQMRNDETENSKISSVHLNNAISSFLTNQDKSSENVAEKNKFARYFEFLDFSTKHFLDMLLMDNGWNQGLSLNGAVCYVKPSSVRG